MTLSVNHLVTNIGFNAATSAAASQIGGISDPATGALYGAAEATLEIGTSLIVDLLVRKLMEQLPGCCTPEEAMKIRFFAHVISTGAASYCALKLTQFVRGGRFTANQALTLTGITKLANYVLSNDLLRNIRVPEISSEISLHTFTFPFIPIPSIHISLGSFWPSSWFTSCTTYCNGFVCRQICN